jgi:hypothetical protein
MARHIIEALGGVTPAAAPDNDRLHKPQAYL